MSIIEEIGGIIFSPQKTLESISKKEDITSVFIIVLITIILSMIHTILSPDRRAMFERYEIEINIILLIIIFAVTVILTLILWAIVAGMFRLISMLFGGTGNYKKTFQLLGYTQSINFVLIPIQILIMMVPVLPISISLISFIWPVILTVFAINKAENISLTKAFLVTVIFGILWIVLSIVLFFIIAFVVTMFYV